MARSLCHPVVLALSLAALTGCGAGPQAAPATQEAAVASSGGEWITLFDGSGLERWRGYQRPEVPSAWRVEDGVLAFVPGAGEGGDIMTRDQFGDFELELEWRISEGGNSGVIYRATEDQQYPWQTGPEMQVLDDDRHPDGQIPSHRAGALYDMIVPPEGIARPVGEWNRARIVVQDGRIQQWLNGTQTADIEIGSDEWNRRIAESKWAEAPAYGTRERGHITLQDHGDPVWFRNIRIRPLDGQP